MKINYQYIVNAIRISLPLEKACGLSSFTVIMINNYRYSYNKITSNVKSKIVKLDEPNTLNEFHTCEITEGITTQ